MTLIFDPDRHFQQVILVGCGGTGSEWARLLARTLYDMKRRRLHIPELIFCDPDEVDDTNPGRQLFTPADVGHNKALVLARRFNMALGLGIQAIPEPFNPHIAKSYTTLLCGAVDNFEARRVLAAAHSCVWIDAGNAHSTGQVVIGNEGNAQIILDELKRLKGDKVHRLPNAALLFPELLEPEQSEPAPRQACAERVAIGEQHPLVNTVTAAVAGQYSYNLLHRKPLTTNLSFISLDPPAIRSNVISAREIRDRLTSAEGEET